MNIKQIQQRAKELGIKRVVGVKKVTLIHAIQDREGNFPCYATAVDGYCDREDCVWYKDCLKDSIKH